MGSTTNQVMERLIKQIQDAGIATITDRDPGTESNMFEFVDPSDVNVGGGIEIFPGLDGPTVKVSVKWEHAMHVQQTVPVPEALRGEQAILLINYSTETFNARVFKRDGFWSAELNGRLKLAVWAPEGPVDERLIRRCMAFIRLVFVSTRRARA